MKKIALFFLLSSTLFAKEKLPIEEDRLLSFGLGIFNIVRNTMSINFQIEYWSNFPFYRNSVFFFRPLIGIMATTTKSAYFFGGIAFDIFFTQKIVFTPSFSP